jgi:hypothetical protein
MLPNAAGYFDQPDEQPDRDAVHCVDCGESVSGPIFCSTCLCCSRCCGCDGPRNEADDYDPGPYEFGGESESYRRDMIDAGRGYLLR